MGTPPRADRRDGAAEMAEVGRVRRVRQEARTMPGRFNKPIRSALDNTMRLLNGASAAGGEGSSGCGQRRHARISLSPSARGGALVSGLREAGGPDSDEMGRGAAA